MPIARVLAEYPAAWARLALAVAAGGAAWTLARWFWLLVAGPALDTAGTQWSAPPPAAAVEAVDPGRYALFGRAGPVPAAAAQPESLVETGSALELRGLVAGGDGSGLAVIAGPGGQQVYRVGDTLPGGERLAAVAARHVVIERDGRREKLSLPRQRLTSSLNGATTVRAPPAPGAARRLPGIRGADADAGAGGAVTALAGDSLPPQMQQLAGAVRVAPASGRGFRVFPGSNSEWFERAGLRAGDVVTAVNGQPVADMQAAVGLLRRIDPTSRVSVTVLREGREVQLQSSLRELLQQ